MNIKDIVLISGANGHLAKSLSEHLKQVYEIRYLTTKKKTSKKKNYFYWNIQNKTIDQNALIDCTHIIHLAGASILNRWSKKNKKNMYESRVKSANLIFNTCKKINSKPKTFISASAIGIYDQSLEGSIKEGALKASDWLGKMACDWEDAANKFKELGCRVIKMRISLIFSDKAGYLKYNLLSMKFGLGIMIGGKNRKISWMHVQDISRFIQKSIIDNSFNGAYNLGSKENITQEIFFSKIKKQLFPYSIIISIPRFFTNIILGKRSQIINCDLDINSNKLMTTGFKYEISSIDQLITKLKSK